METVGEFEYYKKDLIGHGAFAVVFKGRNKKKTDFVVAIKSITKKNLSKSQNLLGKEIKILKELTELHHENVVALLDCKETTQHVFLVMEYCNGGDLADYLQAKGTLSEDTIRIFLRQIAGAMKALNAKGIVHRDLKPQNILLCHSGKPNPAPTEIKLKIADFGFARFLQDGVMAATLCGSPMYMAPEVIMSLQYDAKADLWSIGTIVFQCLTGKAPFQAQTPQALKQFYEKNANLVPNIPSGTSAELKDLLFKLLKRNAKDRLEFDFFFNHPFLKLGAKKPTSPVPVPTRQRSFLDDGPSRPPFNLPLSTASPPSPSRSEREQCQVSLVQEENTVVAEKAGTSPGSRCSSDTEDFVLVPANLPTDLTCDGGPQTRKSTDFDSPPLSTTPPGKNQVVIPRSSGPVIYIKNQFSPPRPSSLPVQTNQPQTANATYTSEPIPVPSQKQAYEQIQQSLQESPGHKEKSASPISSSPKRIAEPQLQTATVQCSSQSGELYKTACTSANITSLSPPAVQFTIGTPPNTGRRRSLTQGTPPPITNLQCITPPPHSARCSTTPPNSGSPNRRSGNTPTWTLSTTPTFTGPNTLPTIIGSPVKTPTKFEFPPTVVCNDNLTSPSAPLNAPFCPRTRTLPEMGTIDYTLGLSQTKMNDNFAETSGNFFKKSGSAGKLSEQLLLKAAFGSGYNSNSQLSGESPPNTLIMAYRERSGSLPFSLNREQSIGKFNNAAYYETSPTNSLPYGTSPPNMEGPIMFVAPDLPQETLMEREHNETLAKLNFVLALVDCIIELAKAKATPIAVLTESMMQRECDRYMDQIIFNGEGYRRAEQLVLYMRALQMLTSSLNLAKEEIQAGKLQPSNSVKLVITALNNRFRICFRISKQLSGGVLQAPGVDPNSSTMTADRLIYNHAIEMCQAAALDELFGKPQECFHRYQVAQILLHSLSQQVSNEHDRDTLLKYKDAVEKRLFVLQNQGYIYAYDS